MKKGLKLPKLAKMKMKTVGGKRGGRMYGTGAGVRTKRYATRKP